MWYNRTQMKQPGYKKHNDVKMQCLWMQMGVPWMHNISYMQLVTMVMMHMRQKDSPQVLHGAYAARLALSSCNT